MDPKRPGGMWEAAAPPQESQTKRTGSVSLKRGVNGEQTARRGPTDKTAQSHRPDLGSSHISSLEKLTG